MRISAILCLHCPWRWRCVTAILLYLNQRNDISWLCWNTYPDELNKLPLEPSIYLLPGTMQLTVHHALWGATWALPFNGVCRGNLLGLPSRIPNHS